MLPDTKNQIQRDVAHCDGPENKLRVCHMQDLLCGLVTVICIMMSN